MTTDNAISEAIEARNSGDLVGGIAILEAALASNIGEVETAATAFGLEATRALSDLMLHVDSEDDADLALRRLAQADCALARCAVDRNELTIGLALLERWLTNEVGGDSATELLREVAEITDQDWLKLCRDYHERQNASVDMMVDLMKDSPEQGAALYPEASAYLPHMRLEDWPVAGQ